MYTPCVFIIIRSGDTVYQITAEQFPTELRPEFSLFQSFIVITLNAGSYNILLKVNTFVLLSLYSLLFRFYVYLIPRICLFYTLWNRQRLLLLL